MEVGGGAGGAEGVDVVGFGGVEAKGPGADIRCVGRGAGDIAGGVGG